MEEVAQTIAPEVAVPEVAEAGNDAHVEQTAETTPANISATPAAAADAVAAPDDDVTGMRRHGRTHSCFVTQEDVEVLVVEHSNLDSTMLSSLGKHAQVSLWKVLVAGRTHPIRIEVRVDKSVARAPMVSVTATDGDSQEDVARIFPAFGTQSTSRMTEDIVHTWVFRGVPSGFRKKHFHEVRLTDPRSGREDWIAATVTEWKQDGTFDVRVTTEEAFGVKNEVVLVGVKAQDLREKKSGSPIYMNSRSMLLEVPREMPHKATLKVVEDGEAESVGARVDATCFLGRWSPMTPGAHCEAVADSVALNAVRKASASSSPTVEIKVTRDKLGLASIRANVGHSALTDFMSGDVRAVDSKTTPPSASAALKKEWKIQLSSLVEHTIEISRASRTAKVVTVAVDGVRLAQAAFSDLFSLASDGTWQLMFRIVGDRFLEFQMNESYSVAERGQKKLEQTMLPYYERSVFPDRVVTPLRYKHACRIMMKDLSSLGHATLFVDNIHFMQLRRPVPARSEANVELSGGMGALDLFSRRYSIELPRNEIQNTYTRGVDQGIRRPVGAFVETLPTIDAVTDSISSATSCSLDFLTVLKANIASLWTTPSTAAATEVDEKRERIASAESGIPF
eukprot:TRINITY_DN2015_c2_g1_i1.p1 TRINITY_DN2015_c2_g1~~TRINITY_DN2015_c2_g1_i1.p1  ORF type:complete len:622 (+),score=92.79 TRINITY_DN2015_c2_g1_i1:64-1929(+)